MDQGFHRIKRLPPYVFTELNALKARAPAAGHVKVKFRRDGKVKMPAGARNIVS